MKKCKTCRHHGEDSCPAITPPKCDQRWEPNYDHLDMTVRLMEMVIQKLKEENEILREEISTQQQEIHCLIDQLDI